MKRPIIIIISVVVVFLLLGTLATSMFGFSGRSAMQNTSFGYGGGGAPEFDAAPPMEAPAAEPQMDFFGNDAVKSEESFNTGTQTQERMVIENADLAIVVADPRVRMTEITRLANEMGGYVVSSNLYQSFSPAGKEIPEATIVIRVPSERLDEALAAIKESAVDIQYENRSGQDVTNIYVDLQSQLRAKQAAEEQLLEILDKAETAEDVLAIYLQLQTVQSEIEVLKGQIKYYEESAALSSISVRLIAEAGTQPIEIGPWKPEGAVREAIQDLIRFLQNFVDFLIRFVIFTLPALVLIAIPLYLLFIGGRAIFRRTRKANAVVEETDEVKK